MTRSHAGLGGRIAVAATALLLAACSSSGTLEEIAAGAEGVAAPSPSASSTAGGKKPAPTSSPSTAAGAASPSASASPAPPATTIDDLAELCAVGDRLLSAGVVSHASTAFERALGHDEDLACAREGYEAALIARRESAVLGARAASEPKEGRALRLHLGAVARDYTSDEAYEDLVAAAEAYEGRGRCKRALEAADDRLHAIARALANDGEGRRCKRAAASGESAEGAAALLLGVAGEEDSDVVARDFYLTALEMDPTLATTTRAKSEGLTNALEGIVPEPGGRAKLEGLRDRLVELSEDVYEGLDSLVKVGILLTLLVVILMTALTYVPGVTTSLRWLSRRRWDVSRPADNYGRRAWRAIAARLLAPLRAAYRPKFEVPAPKKEGNG